MNSNLAICSVITKDYINYLKVFCFSLMKNNPMFDSDYYVFYENEDISDEDMNDLRKIYNKFIFKKVPVENYKHLNPEHYTGTDYSKSIRRFAYYRIEMFNLKNYDKVIYFDVDMIVIKNLQDLFDMRYDEGIMACEDLLVKVKNLKSKDFYEKHHKVQGGLIVAGKDLLTGETYKNLLNLLKDTRRFKLADQSMFAEHFGKMNKIKKIGIEYNCGRKLVRDNHVDIRQVRIIHYPGSGKPTSNKFCKTYKYWQDVNQEMIKNNM